MVAALVFPILAIKSLPVPPFVSTMRPRYVKDCTSSRTSPYSVFGLLFFLLIFMFLVLPLFTCIPNMAAIVSISDAFSCIRFWLKDKPSHRQSQDHLVVPVVSIVNLFLSFCRYYGPVDGHQEQKW